LHGDYLRHVNVSSTSGKVKTQASHVRATIFSVRKVGNGNFNLNITDAYGRTLGADWRWHSPVLHMRTKTALQTPLCLEAVASTPGGPAPTSRDVHYSTLQKVLQYGTL